MKTMRKLGIAGVDEVPWGTHVCHCYASKNQLLAALIPFLKTGLENNEACVLVTIPSLSSYDVVSSLQNAIPDFENYLENEQLEILSCDQWYLTGGKINAEAILKRWADKLNLALKRGYSGLRAAGTTDWISGAQWTAWMKYEEEVEKAIRQFQMIALCNFSRTNTPSTLLLNIIKTHQLTCLSQKGEARILA